MFKKHAVQVKLVKTPKSDTTNEKPASRISDADKKFAKDMLKLGACYVGGYVATYVVLDTARQVTIAIVNRTK